MTIQSHPQALPQRIYAGPILVTGFAVTVGIWLAAYISRLPMIRLPGDVTIAAMLAIIFVGGFLLARRSGLPAAIAAGALSGLLDLVLISSLFHELKPADLAVAPSVVLWVGGSIVFNAFVSTVGGTLGLALPAKNPKPLAWGSVFSLVLVVATFFLIVAGGFVTAFHAGLAVPDWPQSFGYNMFLFPLSLMQKDSDKFFEHAHRLLGSLVGLTTLALAIYLTCTDRRVWVKILVWAIFVGVGLQGILGGIRVTDKSEHLAIVHGVFAQIVFAAMAVLVAVTTRNFQSLAARKSPAAGIDRGLTGALVLLLICQLILGAIVRHTNSLLMMHITVAVLVTFLVLACGFRAWGIHGELRPVRNTGIVLLLLVCVQIVLGVLALIFWNGPAGEVTDAGVLLTTAHQVNGALLLATATILAAWTFRLLTPATTT